MPSTTFKSLGKLNQRETMPRLFHETLSLSSQRHPELIALRLKQQTLSYAELNITVECIASAFLSLGLQAEQRIAIYLPKQFETVISFYACSQAGGVFVPVNPLLKGRQVNYILQDCCVSLLVTSLSRYQQMKLHFDGIGSLHTIVLTDCDEKSTPKDCLSWQSLLLEHRDQIVPPSKSCRTKSCKTNYCRTNPGRISLDMAAILYTSGSTGAPKGVVLSHQNLVSGAKSVAEYLNNNRNDRLLAVLPFSFDYGLSQMTTAFLKGATLVLMEYLFPKDVIQAVKDFAITGLAAVPPLWIELAALEWPAEAQASLRYITNSGGVMPQSTLKSLRQKLPTTLPYLMYGLTEAFRSTFLDPKEIDNRPTSIGKAIPDADILVINQKGELAKPGEEGELVHRGPHVAMGYWNAEEKTAMRFKPLAAKLVKGLTTEIAVWSGDTVTRDKDGFLYFIGRKDDMIKSSGYRISPAEIEECLYRHDAVVETAAIGEPHAQLGQAIVALVIIKANNAVDADLLLNYCRKQLPNFMQPKRIILLDSLPKNANGKIDRAALQQQFADIFTSSIGVRQ